MAILTVLTLWPRILLGLSAGAGEVTLAQVGWMIVDVYVAPPLTMGAWSIAMNDMAAC